MAGESDWGTSLEKIQNWKFNPHMGAFKQSHSLLPIQLWETYLYLLTDANELGLSQVFDKE